MPRPKLWLKPAFAGLLVCVCQWAAAGPLDRDNDQFLDVDQAFQPQAVLGDDAVTVTWQIADDYYLYRHALDFRAAGGAALGEPEIPDGERRTDEFFGEVETYRNQLSIRIPVTSEAAPENIEVTYQGCADAGLCYPPQTRTLDIVAAGGNGQAAAPSTGGGPSDAVTEPGQSAAGETAGFVAEQDRIATILDESAPGWIALSFLGLGLLLAFTPCVLPMIPILSGVIVGDSGHVNALRGFVLSLTYVLAMAAAYTVFGILAGLFGANLQALLQSPWALVPFALVFVALSLSMFGFYELQLPAAWQSRLNAVGRGREGGVIGAGLMGFVAALIAGPCLAPPLAGALLYIGASGDALLGGLALFALGLGMGLPLIALGTIGGGVLPRAGAWMDEIKRLFGVILLGVAIWLLARILPGPLILLLWASLLAGYGIHLGATEPLDNASGDGRRLAKAAGLLGLVYAAILLVGAASGAADPLRPLRPLTAAHPGNETTAADAEVFRRIDDAEALRAALDTAARNNRPALVDFYADWCVECVQMERTVFAKQRVREALASVATLQVDVTDYDAADRKLMRAYGVMGPPTMLFYGADGRERENHRLVGEVDADGFIRHLQRAIEP